MSIKERWVLLAVLLLATGSARADLITELGGGIKVQESFVLSPECRRVVSFDPAVGYEDGELHYSDDGAVRRLGRTFPCGGNALIFLGYPIAWQFPNGAKIGWAHMSSIFDGGGASQSLFPGYGDEWEATFDCLCGSYTFHWFRHRRRR